MRALMLTALFVSSFAWGLPIPDDDEMDNQRIIVQRLLDQGKTRDELPGQMALWFGRQFEMKCDFDRTCVLYNYQLTDEGRVWDYHEVGPIPAE